MFIFIYKLLHIEQQMGRRAMDNETLEIEYNWQGTNFEGMPEVFIEATFQLNEIGRNPISGQMEYNDELVEFDCSFEGFGDDSCIEAMKDLFFRHKSLHDYIEAFILEEWRKRL